MLPVYILSRPIPSPLSRMARGSLARPTAYTPLPPSQQLRMACDATCFSVGMRQPRPFRHSSLTATPTRSQGGSFERGDQNEQFSPSQLFDQSSRAEQSAPKDRRKFPEYTRTQIFGLDADILTSRASTTAGTVRERVCK
jgi:hypothetical protein